MRARRSLGMILHAKERQRAMAHAFVGVVVQIDVGDFHVARRKRIGIDAKAVILRGNFHFSRAQILHRMVRAVMTEFQLEGAAAEGQPAKLVAETNAENRDAAQEFANVGDGIPHGFGISGAIRQKHAIGLQRENVFRGSLRRDHGHVAAIVDEQAQNILFDAEIEGHDFAALLARRIRGGARIRRRQINRATHPFVGFGRSDAAREVLAGHGGQCARLGNQSFIRRAVGCHDSAQHSCLAQVPDKRAGVQVVNHGNLVALEIFLRGFARPPIGSQHGKFADDEALDIRLRGFLVVEIGAHVADMRIGEADDLPGIAGVGENFLVAGEAGIENDFAAAARARSSRASMKHAPVLKRERGATCSRLGQRVLLKKSSRRGIDRRRQRKRTKMIRGPVGKHGFAINILARDGAEHSRIVGTVAMISHHEIFIRGNFYGRIT